MWIRWVYLVALVPTLTEWIENGNLPERPREALTDLCLTALLLGAAWLLCRQADRIAALAELDPLTGLLNSRRFAESLAGSVRRHVDRCFRLGGDEFAILLPGTGLAAGAEVVGRVRADAAPELARYGAGMSVGVVELTAADDERGMLRRADALMYDAKADGGNRIRSA